MKSYLGVAADVQKGRAKPGWPSPGERRQGVAAMWRREEAGSLHQSGGHLSQNEGRVSPLRTKPSLLVPRSSRPTSKAVRWPGGMVRPALMIGKRFVSLTDEVPRGSSLSSIIWTYKALPKWFSHASAAGTATPWPRSWGCLQRHSTSPSVGDRKAKPQSQFSSSVGSRDKLASAKKRSLRPTLTCNEARIRRRTVLSCRRVSPFLGHSSVPLKGNRTRLRTGGVARCGKSARRSSMGNRPHCDNGEGVALASPLPTEGVRGTSVRFMGSSVMPCLRVL